MKIKIAFIIIVSLLIFGCTDKNKHAGQAWSIQKANEWYSNQSWITGANFVPSTAINQLEMWQEETFDPETIDRELGWASAIGFNSMRVFLHHLVWQDDPEAYLNRIENYLEIADKHHICTMFVFFDDVWNPYPLSGKQPDPTPHIHNSGWVQCPGAEILKDNSRHIELKSYFQGIMKHFKDDKRVLIWDLYNEPANQNSMYKETEIPHDKKKEYSLHLLQKAFEWSREINPSQPLTVGVWRGEFSNYDKMDAISKLSLDYSDIISFHNYSPNPALKERTEGMMQFKRPVICTEYMARTAGSTFFNTMLYFKRNSVGAYNWGLVSGKSQTIYPWKSWQEKFTDEPEIWFHDIFRKDGTPYDSKEIELIKRLTKSKH